MLGNVYGKIPLSSKPKDLAKLARDEGNSNKESFIDKLYLSPLSLKLILRFKNLPSLYVGIISTFLKLAKCFNRNIRSKEEPLCIYIL